MSNNNSENSRKVTIFRTVNFLQEAQKNEGVADFMSMSQKPIGPYYLSNTSKIIGSGLSLQEQEILLPYILNMSKEDRDFKKSVYNFYNSLVTKVPFGNGITLEIGLRIDNNKPISEDNLPLNVEQYVRYRHAKDHPWVASNRTEAQTNQLKTFYIYDPEAQEREDNDKMVLQDKADSIWLQIKSQSGKINMLLTLIGLDERDYVGKNEEIKKQKAVRDFIDNNASKFLDIYEADRFELRYWLKAMTTAGVVQRVGSSFVVAENKKLLGNSELEALLFLEDKKNDDTVMFLKSNTQDVLRKPRSVRAKRT